jgi:hypothetical protein
MSGQAFGGCPDIFKLAFLNILSDSEEPQDESLILNQICFMFGESSDFFSVYKKFLKDLKFLGLIETNGKIIEITKKGKKEYFILKNKMAGLKKLFMVL